MEWGPSNRQGLMVGVRYHIKYRINRNTNARRKDQEKCRRVQALNANTPKIGDQSAPLLPNKVEIDMQQPQHIDIHFDFAIGALENAGTIISTQCHNSGNTPSASSSCQPIAKFLSIFKPSWKVELQTRRIGDRTSSHH